MSTSQQKVKLPNECNTKEEIRAEIDRLDKQIIDLFAERLQYVHAIARFKNTAEEVVAQSRYDSVIETRRQWAANKGLSSDVIEGIYRTLLNYGINEEHKLVKNSIK